MNEYITIRKADKFDAEGKGYVHYTSWIETYTGLFKQSYLDKLSLEKSVKMAYDHPGNSHIALIDSKIVGFACYLEARDEDLTNTGEIVAIYILKKHQGKGIGKLLMDECYKELKAYKSIILWVLKDNKKSVRFYESQGFKIDGKKKILYEKILIRLIKDKY